MVLARQRPRTCVPVDADKRRQGLRKASTRLASMQNLQIKLRAEAPRPRLARLKDKRSCHGSGWTLAETDAPARWRCAISRSIRRLLKIRVGIAIDQQLQHHPSLIPRVPSMCHDDVDNDGARPEALDRLKSRSGLQIILRQLPAPEDRLAEAETAWFRSAVAYISVMARFVTENDSGWRNVQQTASRPDFEVGMIIACSSAKIGDSSEADAQDGAEDVIFGFGPSPRDWGSG